MKTIVVEDEGIMALFLKESLEELGHEVLATFRNANKLFEYLKSNSDVDLIFMDILIDGSMDGLQAGEHLQEKYKGISLVFITSYKDSETIKLAQASKPLGFLIKPIGVSDLEAILMVIESSNKTVDDKSINEIKIGCYIYSKSKKSIYENEEFIKLSSLEVLCLDNLIKNINAYISHEQLIFNLWGDNSKSEGSLRELIYRIRKKLPDLQILSTPNIGYTLITK